MQCSPREKLLFAAPPLVLLLSLASKLIRNRLFEQSPDRIVIDNNGAVDISLLRLSYKGHPDAAITIGNIPAHRQRWRLFNRKWLKKLTPAKEAYICVEGIGASGARFGQSAYYFIDVPNSPRYNSMQLVVQADGMVGGAWWAEFRPSTRAKNESFWRDLGDALFHRPQESS